MLDQDAQLLTNFGGLFKNIDEDLIPPNHFKDCLNLQFIESSVQTRRGTVLEFNITGILRIARYEIPGEADRILALRDDGFGNGTIYDTTASLSVPILTVAGMTDFACVSLFGRAYISPHNGEEGLADTGIYVYDPAVATTARLAAGEPPSDFTLTATPLIPPTVANSVIVATVAAANGALTLTSNPYQPNTPTSIIFKRITGTITAITFTVAGIDNSTRESTSKVYIDKIVNTAGASFTTFDTFFRIDSITVSALAGAGTIQVLATGQPPGKVEAGTYVVAIAYETASGFITRPGPASGDTTNYTVVNVPAGRKALRISDIPGTAGSTFEDPTDITGLKLWLDASQIVGLVDGDPVSTWTDFSGLANNFTGAGATRPTYQTNEINSKPIVRFDGTDDVLTGPAISALVTGDAYTAFVVYKDTSSGNTQRGLFQDTSTRLTWVNYGETVYNLNNGTTGYAVKNFSRNAYHSATFMHNSGFVSIGVDDTRTASLTNGVAGTTTPLTGLATLGRRFAPFSGFFLGDVAEVIIYNEALSESNRKLVESYLAQKYALTLPYSLITGATTLPAGVVKVHILISKAIVPARYNGNPDSYELFFVPLSAGGVVEPGVTFSIINFFNADLIDSADFLKDNLSLIPAGVVLLATSKGRLLAAGMNSTSVVGGFDPNNTVIYGSKGGEPESFSITDGFVIVKPGGEGLRNLAEYRGLIYAYKPNRTYVTQDNGDQLVTWEVESIDNSIGAECHSIPASLGSDSSTQDFLFVAARTGLQLFTGVYADKPLSWKIKEVWDNLAMGQFRFVQLAIDPQNKVLLVALPDDPDVDDNTLLYMMDYSQGLTWDAVRWVPWILYRPTSEIDPTPIPVRPTSIISFTDSSLAVDATRFHIGNSDDAISYQSLTHDVFNDKDGNVAIDGFLETHLISFSEKGGVSQCTGLRLQVQGPGTITNSITGPEDVTTESLPDIVFNDPNDHNVLQKLNFIEDEFSIRLETNAAGERMQISKLWVYGNEAWVERPA